MTERELAAIKKRRRKLQKLRHNFVCNNANARRMKAGDVAANLRHYFNDDWMVHHD